MNPPSIVPNTLEELGETVEIVSGPHDGEILRVCHDADWLTLWHNDHPYRYMRIGPATFALCAVQTAKHWGDQ